MVTVMALDSDGAATHITWRTNSDDEPNLGRRIREMKNVKTRIALILTFLCYVFVYPVSRVFVSKYADDDGVWILPLIVLTFSAFSWLFCKLWLPFVGNRLPKKYKFFRAFPLVVPDILLIAIHIVILVFFVMWVFDPVV